MGDVDAAARASVTAREAAAKGRDWDAYHAGGAEALDAVLADIGV